MVTEPVTPAQERPKKRRTLGIALALLAFGSIVWLIALKPALVSPDSFDYAQMGRELNRGFGFSTLQVLPGHIPFLVERGHWSGEHWPNLYRHPMTPLLIAASMVFIENPVLAAVVQSGIWFVLSVPLVFLLTRKFVGEGTAIFCALLFLSDPDLMRSSHSGMSESLAIFVVLAVFASAHLLRSSDVKWLLIGGLCGVAYLSRTQLIAILPIGLLYATARESAYSRKRAVIILLTSSVLVASPWLVRNLLLTGDLTFDFSTARNLLRYSSSHDPDLDLSANQRWPLVASQGQALVGMWYRNAAQIFTPGFWTGLIGLRTSLLLALILAAASFGSGPRDRDTRRLRRAALLFILLTSVATTLAFHRSRFYYPIRPLIVIIACIEVSRRVPQPRLRPSSQLTSTLAATALLAAGGSLAIAATLDQIQHSRLQTEGFSVSQTVQQKLNRIVPKEEWVLSDVSYRVALLADRRSIRLPQDPNQVLEILERFPKARYLLLAERALPGGGPGRYPHLAYARFVESTAFQTHFELLEVFPNGESLYRRQP